MYLPMGLSGSSRSTPTGAPARPALSNSLAQGHWTTFRESDDCHHSEAGFGCAVPGTGDQAGFVRRSDAAHHGSEGHRDPVPGDVVRVVPDRRADGAADARRARPAGPAVPLGRAVQPAVHDARHDHAAAVRDADPVRLRELHRAAADRRARRGVPAAQRLLLLAVPLRGADRALRASSPPAARADFGWFAYTPLSDVTHSPGFGERPVDHGPGRVRPGHHPRRGQLHHDHRLPARAGHDDVPDADLHLEHPGHRDPDPDRLPDPDRGTVRAGWPTDNSARTSSTRPTAERSSGSTCSGSSATPRSTSSRCPSSASSPRSSRCSAGSRSSATRR